MEIEKLIDRYFLALERKVIREIYNKHTREELEKFILNKRPTLKGKDFRIKF